MDELRAAFASPEGRATAADAARLQELTPVRSMIFTVDDSVGESVGDCRGEAPRSVRKKAFYISGRDVVSRAGSHQVGPRGGHGDGGEPWTGGRT